MKKLLLLMLFIPAILTSQTKLLLKQNEIIKVPSDLQGKILSGRLIHQVSEKIFAKKNQAYLQQNNISIKNENYSQVVIYFEKYPTQFELNELDKLNIKYYLSSWTPPLENHPLGFILAQIPVENLIPALELDFVKKMGSSEVESSPNNNEAAKKIKADLAWADGWTGTGVKVAILDSGLDTDPANSDLPGTIEKRDYSNFPTSIDNIVENTVSGHGTHVTGSVLGRGVLSTGNTGNGSGQYKGMAPNADLVFLKIGSDATSNATSAAMIAAMHAAVDTFSADILSMSYGGWYDFHDGSSAEEQTIDWVYSQGKPFFLSAGNDGGSARHYSGTVAANSSTDFIQINVTGAGTNNTALYFNLVWSDGASRNNLSIQYYNSAQVLLASTNYTVTESSRGTESAYSNYNFYVPSGSSTWYIKVVNPSASSQAFHIYDDWGNGLVKFNSPDPFYTIGQPASADHAFSVGAFVSRKDWTAYDGGIYHYNSPEILNDIATFSSRGPRIDGVTEPLITAPGSAIISIRDRDVYTASSALFVDNDGTIGSGDMNYYIMQGTSMATPVTAGAGTLILQKFPAVTPQQVYDAITSHSATDAFTGTVPNNTWGYGKLDINSALSDVSLPVELTSFIGSYDKDKVVLSWQTASEVNNYGFEIEQSRTPQISSQRGGGSGNSSSFEAGWEKIGFVNGHGNSNTLNNYKFVVDHSVLKNKFCYRLKQIDNDGKFKYSDVVEVAVLPGKFALEQNYPNPFNPATTINYALASDSKVKISLFNVLGEKVADVVNQIQAAGYQQAVFNGSNLSSGVYYYILEASPVNNETTFRSVKKMILMK